MLFVAKHKDSHPWWSFKASQVASFNNTKGCSTYFRSQMTKCANECAWFGHFQKCSTECKRKLQSSYRLSFNMGRKWVVANGILSTGTDQEIKQWQQKYHSLIRLGTVFTIKVLSAWNRGAGRNIQRRLMCFAPHRFSYFLFVGLINSATATSAWSDLNKWALFHVCYQS